MNKNSRMTGFKLGTSGEGSDRSTNWVTTTAQQIFVGDYFWLDKIFFSFSPPLKFSIQEERGKNHLKNWAILKANNGWH